MTAEQRHPQLALRAAREQDSEMLMALRNDHDAVRFSVTGRTVARDEHERWFARVLAEPARSRVWIAEEGGAAVGQVRVDVGGDAGTVSIAVGADHRGRGLGRAMLEALIAKVSAEGAPSRLTAVVRADNTASLRAFAAAGFRHVSPEGEFLALEWP